MEGLYLVVLLARRDEVTLVVGLAVLRIFRYIVAPARKWEVNDAMHSLNHIEFHVELLRVVLKELAEGG